MVNQLAVKALELLAVTLLITKKIVSKVLRCELCWMFDFYLRGMKVRSNTFIFCRAIYGTRFFDEFVAKA